MYITDIYDSRTIIYGHLFCIDDQFQLLVTEREYWKQYDEDVLESPDESESEENPGNLDHERSPGDCDRSHEESPSEPESPESERLTPQPTQRKKTTGRRRLPATKVTVSCLLHREI